MIPVPSLDDSVLTVPGIGEYRGKALAGAGVCTVRDLIYYFPRRYLDRSTIRPISGLRDEGDEVVTVIGTVLTIRSVPGRKPRLTVTIGDQGARMDLVFFQGVNYWKDAFAPGDSLAASGRPQRFGSSISIVHPDIDRLQEGESLEFINTGGIIPVYPSSAELERVGLNRHGGFRRLLRRVVDRWTSHIEDPYADAFRALHTLIPLGEALRAIHFPRSEDDLNQARHRLIFDEFFLVSLLLAYRKRGLQMPESGGIAFHPPSPRARQLLDALPFSLTRAQKRVVREIIADMERPLPMNRLLQGDVGSGKTIVALLAMLLAVDNGWQAALMAPTELLAEQHFRTITARFNDLSLHPVLLSGRLTATQRAPLLAAVASGAAHLVIGTHALLENTVAFHRLGLAVIDEQHRFGVSQRATLGSKGTRPDVLVMTATPIPRTLSMTVYGDLDVSVIDELPEGRRPIRTVIRMEEERESVHAFLREECAKGRQAFIVYPLVEESEKVDLKNATEGYEHLRTALFPDRRVGLLHGRMKGEEKDAIMMAFARGELDLLVATTVIEVGIDVPNATVMVVEHAERFGLAQLHQLRGRIGRGDQDSICILMTDRTVRHARGDAWRRLEVIAGTTDGFRIAEADLEIRGPGDLWGTQQSGFPDFRIASLVRDGAILAQARQAAFSIVETDPHLRLAEHRGLLAAFGPQLRQRTHYFTVA